jgi:hypothetical protein
MSLYGYEIRTENYEGKMTGLKLNVACQDKVERHCQNEVCDLLAKNKRNSI